jgi:lantibiotic biosynthesis protein
VAPEAPARAAWGAVLPPPTRAGALAVARDVVGRCTDPERLRVALAAARQQTSFPRSVYWEPAGIAQGDAGLALMAGYAAAAFPDDGWDLAAHEELALAVRGAQSPRGPGAGLFSGLAGLAFTIASLSSGGARYQRALGAVREALLPSVTARAASMRALRGMSVSEFDVVTGLAGVTAALLALPRDPATDRVLADVLAALAELVEADEEPPRWFTPPEQMADERWEELYPHGNLNCGLAHGIPGPLAAMALAALEGVEVEGLTSAIARAAQWLVEHRADDAWGLNWPTAVSVDSGLPDAPSRAAWCYGAPGVTRALWLAGRALDDAGLREMAVEGLEAVHRRPVDERWIDSPTFCHGVAGLLQVTLRFAHDTGRPSFMRAADELTEQLLDAYDGTRLLGFASLEPGGNHVDQPGMLDGAPGVALVLLAAATDAEPAWDRVFLLS